MGAAIGILLVQTAQDTKSLNTWVLAIAAGSFLYLALGAIMPQIGQIHVKGGKKGWPKTVCQHVGMITGWVVMVLIALYGENIQM